MKKALFSTSLLFMTLFLSIFSAAAATEYVGIVVDDIFVWEIDNGGFITYAKYEITGIIGDGENQTAISNLSVFDVYIDAFAIYTDVNFPFFYPKTQMDIINSLETGVTNKTLTYGGLERDCRVLPEMPGYDGAVTVDAATGIFLEMTVETIRTFRLISWEDQDLLGRYKPKSGAKISGYGLPSFGIFSVVVIGWSLRKFRSKSSSTN